MPNGAEMILLELKRYIQIHQTVPESQLLHRFDISAHTLDGLLQPLIHQGYIRVLYGTDASYCSGGCRTGCAATAADTRYAWSHVRQRPIALPLQVRTAPQSS